MVSIISAVVLASTVIGVEIVMKMGQKMLL